MIGWGDFRKIADTLQAADGESTGPRYKAWCDQFLANSILTGGERWRLRCKVLHQGRATTDQSGRYTDFAFGRPAETGETDHYRVAGSTLHIDVGRFATETLDGLNRWIAAVASPAAASATTVAKNLPTLVKVSRGPVVLDTGVIITSMKTSRW